MLSQSLLNDEPFNTLSKDSQLLFIRMLTISDDYGITPASEYELKTVLNLGSDMDLAAGIREIVKHKLGKVFQYDGKRFFAFKPKSFDDHQKYLLKNRRKSEYLKLSREDLGTSGNLLEFIGSSERFQPLKDRDRDKEREKDQEKDGSKRPIDSQPSSPAYHRRIL